MREELISCVKSYVGGEALKKRMGHERKKKKNIKERKKNENGERDNANRIRRTRNCKCRNIK